MAVMVIARTYTETVVQPAGDAIMLLAALGLAIAVLGLVISATLATVTSMAGVQMAPALAAAGVALVIVTRALVLELERQDI